MSNLLEQASLVMIPSGYKEDVVYSEIPLDGSGDMTLTRASNGTRINSAGLVEVCPWNLLDESERFSNWNFQDTSVSSDSTTAPNGTTTADTIIESNTTYEHNRYLEPNIGGGVFTYSIYLKRFNTDWSALYVFNTAVGGVRHWVNLSTLTAGTSANIGSGIGTTSLSLESVGNGWVRASISFTNPSGSCRFYVANAQSNGGATSYAGNGTNGIFAWGAQVNIGSTAKPYFPTTDRLNVPRLTYQNGGGGCPSLLLEKQSTNLLLYSEQFDQWATSGTTTSNVAISPDGTQNADRLNYTSGNVYWLDASVNVTNGVDYTYSLYVKPTSVGDQFRFYIDGAFNVSTVITTDSSDWKRYTWTFTASATGSINPHILLGYGYSSQNTLVWGAQFEASSYATSYIPTTSSSATRVADACYKTGISSLIGQTEGVLFVDFIATTEATLIAINDAANPSTNIMYIQAQIGDVWRAYVVNGGVYQVAITAGSGATGRCKMAFAYKQNDFVLYANGQLILADSSGTVPACNAFYLGYYNGAYLPIQTNQAILFPTRLTNAELASLTTI